MLFCLGSWLFAMCTFIPYRKYCCSPSSQPDRYTVVLYHSTFPVTIYEENEFALCLFSLLKPLQFSVVCTAALVLSYLSPRGLLCLLALQSLRYSRWWHWRCRRSLISSVMRFSGLDLSPWVFCPSREFYSIQSGAEPSGGNLFQRFCSIFSKSSSCLLGQHGSCSAAQQPGELSENILQNFLNKLPPQTLDA